MSVTLQGLTPGATYYYRVHASNALGQAEGEQRAETFETLPGSQGLLADGRAWELVSPAEKDGADIEPLSKEGGLIQASQSGEAITYVANGPVVAEPGGSRAPEPTQVLATRSAAGWSFGRRGHAARERGRDLAGGTREEYRFFSEDLALSLVEPSLKTVEPFEAPPLAPGASEKTLYVRDEPAIAPEGREAKAYAAAQANSGFLAPGFAPLVTPSRVTAETEGGERSRFGSKLGFVDATPSLSTWSSNRACRCSPGRRRACTRANRAPASARERAPGWRTGRRSGTGDRPNSAMKKRTYATRYPDGPRVFFYSAGVEENSEVGEYQRLYMRDTATGKTMQLNAAQGVTEPVGEEGEVGFQAASSDGSRVFFTDTAPLQRNPTSGRSAGRQPGRPVRVRNVETAGRVVRSERPHGGRAW